MLLPCLLQACPPTLPGCYPSCSSSHCLPAICRESVYCTFDPAFATKHEFCESVRCTDYLCVWE